MQTSTGFSLLLVLATAYAAAGCVASEATNNLFSYGGNDYGQLGINSTASSTALQAISNQAFLGDPAEELISTHGEFSIAISKARKQIYFWGRNPLNPSDNFVMPRLMPAQFARVPIQVSHAAAGQAHVLVSSDESVYALGVNTEGQLGDGTFISSRDLASVVRVAYNETSSVVALAAGANHSCLLNALKDLYCWGSNEFGQLGTNATTTPKSSLPIKVMSNVDRVAAGDHHTIVISGSTMYTFGRNNKGQLCQDASVAFADSRQTIVGVKAAWVVGSAANTYIVNTNGTIQCCGANDRGQCATSSTAPAAQYAPVALGTDCLFGAAIQSRNGRFMIAASGARVIANSDNGKLCVWGATPLADGSVTTDTTLLDYQAGGTILATATVEYVATGKYHSLVSTTAPFYVERSYKYFANDSTQLVIRGHFPPSFDSIVLSPPSLTCASFTNTTDNITCDVTGPFPPGLITAVLTSFECETSVPVPVGLVLADAPPMLTQNMAAVACGTHFILLRGINLALDPMDLQVNLTSELNRPSGACDTLRPLGPGEVECDFGAFTPDTGPLYAQVRNAPLDQTSERVLVGEVTDCLVLPPSGGSVPFAPFASQPLSGSASSMAPAVILAMVIMLATAVFGVLVL